jgi:hypothetical protein
MHFGLSSSLNVVSYWHRGKHVFGSRDLTLASSIPKVNLTRILVVHRLYTHETAFRAALTKRYMTKDSFLFRLVESFG